MAQLQALTHLAVLRRGTPTEADAALALQEVYDGSPKGFDTPHLVAARAALAVGRQVMVTERPPFRHPRTG